MDPYTRIASFKVSGLGLNRLGGKNRMQLVASSLPIRSYPYLFPVRNQQDIQPKLDDLNGYVTCLNMDYPCKVLKSHGL